MKIFRDQSGQALVEFALVSSLFILVFAGVVDFGIYIHMETELSEAAAAGAAVGTYTGQQLNTTAMQTAATLSVGDVPGVTAVATYFYSCTPGSSHVTSTTSCSSGFDSNPLMYVQVTTTATVPAVLKWTGLSSSLALKGQAIYRVPWHQ